MTLKFDIFGSFIDSEYEREDVEDITPNIFKESISELKAGDTLEIHINSCGGSCTSGIAIANMIRSLNTKSINTICIVDGICASIATLTAMACKELKMYPQSFLMIHNAWSCVQGDAEKLRREATSLEAMTNAILSFYHEKFNLTDEELKQYMAQLTWISGLDKDNFKLNATILEDNKEFKMAAKMIDIAVKKFNNKTILEKFNNMKDINKEVKCEEVIPEEVKKEVAIETVESVDVPEVKEEVKEEIVEEVKEEINEEKPSYEELEKRIEELTLQLDECQKKLAECTQEDVEKRVSGMQSKMQNKINDLTKEFKDKLELKDKELSEYINQVSDLNNKLETTSKEFSQMKSAYDEKTTALAQLNANVNTPNEFKPLNWRDLKGEDFIKWAESHKDEIRQNKIN